MTQTKLETINKEQVHEIWLGHFRAFCKLTPEQIHWIYSEKITSSYLGMGYIAERAENKGLKIPSKPCSQLGKTLKGLTPIEGRLMILHGYSKVTGAPKSALKQVQQILEACEIVMMPFTWAFVVEMFGTQTPGSYKTLHEAEKALMNSLIDDQCERIDQLRDEKAGTQKAA